MATNPQNSGAQSPTPAQKRFHNGWSKEQENLMSNWADIAACYRWLHDRSEKIYATRNMGMTIPVIILSTFTGSANMGLDSFFGEDETAKHYAIIAIGGISLLAGMLTTLGNFFRFAQLSEAHRVASISWGKFQRLIAVELAIHPNERSECMDFLKICRSELDRLIEQSPQIPDGPIKEFTTKFGGINDIKRPDICGHMEHTHVFQDSQSRLKQVANEAALIIRHKKSLLKELVMPDFQHQIDTAVAARTAVIRKEQQEALERKLMEELEARHLIVPATATNSSDDATAEETKKEEEVAEKKREEKMRRASSSLGFLNNYVAARGKFDFKPTTKDIFTPTDRKSILSASTANTSHIMHNFLEAVSTVPSFSQNNIPVNTVVEPTETNDTGDTARQAEVDHPPAQNDVYQDFTSIDMSSSEETHTKL